MKKYGVDSNIGLIVSTIMGSTETTLYTIAIYTSVVKIKKTRGVLIAALVGDVVRNVDFCSIMSNFVVKKLLTNGIKCSMIITSYFLWRAKMIFKIVLFFFVLLFVRRIILKFLSKRILEKIQIKDN